MSSDLPSLSPEALSIKKGFYEHFKGGRYEVLGVARHSEDPSDEYVVYVSLKNPDRLWIRPVKMFVETVEREGETFPRFKYLGKDLP